MHSDPRRKFLRHLTFSVGSLSLASCGGGTQSAEVGLAGAVAPDATATAAPATPAAAPAAAPAPASAPSSAAIQPRWLANKPINEWFAIPGTIHAGSAAAPTDNPLDPYAASNRRLAYSGMALRQAEIILAACGGHNDYAGNEVTSLDLSLDSPAWVLRKAASAPKENVPYYPDGTPASRHTYWSSNWNAERNRVMLHYSRFVYGSAVSFTSSNGFNLDTNSWDAAGTWADGYGAGCADADGNCYALGDGYFRLKKWTASSDTWSTVATFATAINVNPVCYDNARGHLFALAWGDGQGNALGGGPIGLSAFKIVGAVKTDITFRASDALEKFKSDAPSYSGMEYDPLNDQYLFYEGAAGRTTRMYIIQPNDTAVWDMRLLTLGTGSQVPVAAVRGGVFSRFRYVPALRGFVLMSSGTSELYFMRTA